LTNAKLMEIIQGLLAAILLIGVLVLIALGKPVPTYVSGAVVAVISFFLGAKVSSSTANSAASAASAPVNPKQTGA